MLLAAAWQRLLVAGAVVVLLWAAVIWVAPSAPTTAPARPSVRVGAAPEIPPGTNMGLRAIVKSGQPAPGGGSFDRFAVATQPVVAPVNARGQVAFYATVLRAAGREGIFLADARGIGKLDSLSVPAPAGMLQHTRSSLFECQGHAFSLA